jgi:feruloyl esterase
MRIFALALFLTFAVGGSAITREAPAQPKSDALSCADLAAQRFADVTITGAENVAPGQLWRDAPVGGPPRTAPAAAFCRVQGVIEKEIGFELWLPERTAWNGKFLGAGVGGDAGAFNYQDLPRGVDRGYAAATTDTGHKAADLTWMLGDPMRLANFEVRAHHLLAEKSKALIVAYYGAAAQRAYFIGCSGGGRQGLKELQNFPADYDGVLVGAPGPKTPEMTVRRMWELLLRDRNPGLMSPADWSLVAAQGVAGCDTLDGVSDGIAEDPRRCRLGLDALLCSAAKTPQCLTREQIAFAMQFYAPMHDENGRKIDDGLLSGVLVDSGRSRLAPATFGQAVRKQSDWQGDGFSVKDDLAAIDRVMPELRAAKTNLSAFTRRGGKLIMYSGWMDPAVAARMMTQYKADLDKAAGGAARSSQFSRLYMLPGMLHCGGGPGADQIGGSGRAAPIADARHDLLIALEQWVEKGRAPGPMIASKVEGGAVSRTHLICPYPEAALYRGGNSQDAGSFRCGASQRAVGEQQ